MKQKTCKLNEFLIACIFSFILLLAGCLESPQNTNPDSNSDSNNLIPILDSNALKALKDIKAIAKPGKPISINLDSNTITLGFDYNFSTSNPDTNLLSDSCNATCNALNAIKWSLKKSLDLNVFICYCTQTQCVDQPSPTQITRLCTNNQTGFLFEEKK